MCINIYIYFEILVSGRMAKRQLNGNKARNFKYFNKKVAIFKGVTLWAK